MRKVQTPCMRGHGNRCGPTGCPVWYDDAKLGVFLHWGLYSVPGWAPRVPDIQQLLVKDGPKRMLRENPYAEWYLNSMQIKGSPTQQHHAQVYGDDYPYDNFVKTFNDASSGANLDAIAELCRAAGARYVVLTTKHHDGFALWPSAVAHPVKGEYHARRDLVGDLTEAVRARRMRMGLYYSGGYDWPYNEAVLSKPADAVLAVPHDRRYVEYVTAHWRELIDRYQPSVLWNDISWPSGPQAPRALRVLLQHRGGRRHQRPLEGAGPAPATRSPMRIVRGAGAVVQALWRFIPERRKHLTFATPEALRLPDARVRRPAHGVGAQVGAGPRRRALVRGQPPRAPEDIISETDTDPDVLRRRVEERQPAHRGGPAAGRDDPRAAAGTAARARDVAGRQRGGHLRQPALGGHRVGHHGRDPVALHQERRGRVRARDGDARVAADHHAGGRRVAGAAGAPGRGRRDSSTGRVERRRPDRDTARADAAGGGDGARPRDRRAGGGRSGRTSGTIRTWEGPFR